MGNGTIKIIGFEKDLVLWVAEKMGFFLAQDLAVSVDQTRSSREEILGVLEGNWDVAFDNADNVVGWDEGQGADGKPHDLFIFMGGSQELTQALYVTPEIKEIGELKGKVLGVDAVATGYAVVLRYILQRYGLHHRKDYSLLPLGSTKIRVTKLIEGEISGAMLNPRHVEEIGAASLRLLARGKDYADPYPVRVGLSTRGWAKDHRGLLIRFIKANFMAADWILNPENKHDAIALMTTWMGRTTEAAQKDYSRIVGPEGALPRRGAFDPSALNTVLDLRLKTGLMNPPAPPLNKYFDDSFYREASS
jgi:ABC-type nitrate/sulfonate/bicarbonate transport system substrate-binding protein